MFVPTNAIVCVIRVKEFQKKVVAYGKDVDSFKKKEIITIDEMKNNVEKLSELSDNLTAAMDELDVSNLLMCNVTFRCNLSDLLSWYSQYMSMLSCPLQ